MTIELDWNQIDHVFFDMDGTLLDLHYDNYFWLSHLPERLVEIQGRSREVVEKELNGMFEDLRGSLNWYCLDHWANALNIDILGLKHEVANKIRYREGAIGLIEAIRSQGLPMTIVTNAHPDCLKLKSQYVDIIDRIPKVVTSHDVGHAKEEADFWDGFFRTQAFNPERTVFFDDNEEVLAAAQKFGIRHLLSIAQPDSQKQRSDDPLFYRINAFADIEPV